jgi:predicted dehydrogenase
LSHNVRVQTTSRIKPLGMGLVGSGFIGPHHLDAVRRVSFARPIGVAGSSPAQSKEKAVALGLDRAYDDYHELIADPDIDVIHNTTPNHLHFAVNAAAIKARKHIISDKPLGMNAGESRELLRLAKQAGVFHGVTFNYRGNPLVQHARFDLRNNIGEPRFIHGHYLQDWLLFDTDYSWRLEPERGGPASALGDIGSHWCDLAEHVTNTRITHVLADLTTTVPVRQGHTIRVEDLASVLLRFKNGAKGSFSVSQVAAGHKNDLVLEINGTKASMRWRQEDQNELWIGNRDQPNVLLAKDPNLMNGGGRSFSELPGGHQESWADAFRNIVMQIYVSIINGKRPDKVDGRRDSLSPVIATFEDGYRSNCIVDGILESAKAGGVWTEVPQ